VKLFQNFGTLLERFLLIGTILHAVSLGSSSFVEEEHQTFYFFCSSFVILFAISDHGQSKWNLIGALVLMRISRSWNQTGDKWINEPDIEDWLNAPEHKAYLSISSVLGAFGIHHWIKRHYHLNWIQRIASIIALIATLAYRAALGTFNFSYPKSM